MSQQSSLLSFFKRKDSSGQDSDSQPRDSPIKTPSKEAGKRAGNEEKSTPPSKKLALSTPKKTPSSEAAGSPLLLSQGKKSSSEAAVKTPTSAKKTTEDDRKETAISKSSPSEKLVKKSSDDMFSQFAAKKSTTAAAAKLEPTKSNADANEDDDEDMPLVKPQRKKKVVISDDEDDDFEPLPQKRKSSARDDDSVSDEDGDDEIVPEKATPKPKAKPAPAKKTLTPAKGSAKKTAATPASSGKKSSSEERYFWLENVKDKQGRSPDEEGYDCRTLQIPPTAYKGFTSFEKQFWDIKSNYWDVVIFFKKGKFYELYEKDSEIGFRELGLKMTERVNMSMVGVPEKSFKKFASQLINLGYKVGRVEQMETATDAGKRQKKEAVSTKSKVCNRELCEILTLGTLVEEDLIPGPEANYVMSICETAGTRRVGICLAEVSTANFYFHTFDDNEQYTETETIILRCRPREIVTTHPKGDMISEILFKSLKRNFDPSVFVLLQPGKEFWDSRTTVDEIRNAKYFPDGEWPPLLQELVDSNNTEGLQSVGGCISYLRHLLLDADLIPSANFSQLTSLNQSKMHMILDSTTLVNLNILENDIGTKDGTLLKYLDSCSTPFGRRLLRNWICHPIQNKKLLEERYNCIEKLNENNTLRGQLVQKLKRLCDVERAMGRLINISSKRQGVMFDDTSNRKLKEFAALVDNFDVLQSIWDLIPEDQPLCNVPRPDMKNTIEILSKAFDRAEAREGRAVISEGVLPECDDVNKKISDLKEKLEEFLENQKEKSRNKSITYHMPANQKDVYQMIVEKKWADTHKGQIPSNWKVVSETKNQIRYYTPELEEMASELSVLNEEGDKATQTITHHLVKMFGEHRAVWQGAISSTAQLDCLLSLSFTVDSPSGPSCRPTFCDSGISATNLRHACMSLTQNFVPNDFSIGGEGPTSLIITGSNMSGKSTMLRQVCIAVVMAQVGAFVAAESFEFAPVDRIFTRIGARDRMLQNQSTFMVEMAESAAVLRYATENSLVVFDELGRGTSTFDGYAIAFAVISEILAKRSLCLFATHYQRLASEFEDDSRVGYKHMTCMIDDETKMVTFLYKFVDGVSPRSYGVHCASLAKIPKSVLDCASQKALDMEILTDLQTNAPLIVDLVVKILQQPAATSELKDLQERVVKLFQY